MVHGMGYQAEIVLREASAEEVRASMAEECSGVVRDGALLAARFGSAAAFSEKLRMEGTLFLFRGIELV